MLGRIKGWIDKNRISAPPGGGDKKKKSGTGNYYTPLGGTTGIGDKDTRKIPDDYHKNCGCGGAGCVCKKALACGGAMFDATTQRTTCKKAGREECTCWGKDCTCEHHMACGGVEHDKESGFDFCKGTGPTKISDCGCHGEACRCKSALACGGAKGVETPGPEGAGPSKKWVCGGQPSEKPCPCGGKQCSCAPIKEGQEPDCHNAKKNCAGQGCKGKGCSCEEVCAKWGDFPCGGTVKRCREIGCKADVCGCEKICEKYDHFDCGGKKPEPCATGGCKGDGCACPEITCALTEKIPCGGAVEVPGEGKKKVCKGKGDCGCSGEGCKCQTPNACGGASQVQVKDPIEGGTRTKWMCRLAQGPVEQDCFCVGRKCPCPTFKQGEEPACKTSKKKCSFEGCKADGCSCPEVCTREGGFLCGLKEKSCAETGCKGDRCSCKDVCSSVKEGGFSCAQKKKNCAESGCKKEGCGCPKVCDHAQDLPCGKKSKSCAKDGCHGKGCVCPEICGDSKQFRCGGQVKRCAEAGCRGSNCSCDAVCGEHPQNFACNGRAMENCPCGCTDDCKSECPRKK